MNIDVTNKVNGQTATETKIDREEFFSLLTKIASELFDLIQRNFLAGISFVIFLYNGISVPYPCFIPLFCTIEYLNCLS